VVDTQPELDELFINLGELHEALAGFPETVVEVSDDRRHILLYRDDKPWPPKAPALDLSLAVAEARRRTIAEVCPYTREDPYWIPAEDIRTAGDALMRQAHLALKPWAQSERVLHGLGKILSEVLEANQRSGVS
jgi:hypothetical protein